MGMYYRSGSIRATPRALLSLGFLSIAASFGVLLIAVAYTSARFEQFPSPWPDWTYWLGQAFIVAPVVVRLLSRRFITDVEAIVPVLILTIAQYLVKVCYSPTAFTYSDELSHWRTAQDILTTGRLFTANYNLPISPRYPGLELVTTALVNVTGLSLFSSGLIVAGIAHLTVIGILYVLLRNIVGSARVAGIATLVYYSSPDLPFFDSIYAYQTLALAFFGLALLALWRLSSAKARTSRAGWLSVALAATGATAATHHITSLALICTLLLITLTCAVVGDRRRVVWICGMAVTAVILTTCWIIFVAPETATYLHPIARDMSQTVRSVLHGGQSTTASVSGGPFSDRLLDAGAIVVIALLIPLGVWRVWRDFRGNPWIVSLAIGSLSWYALVVIRLKVSDGSELAGRASTFVYLPVAFMIALIFLYVDHRFSRRHVAVALGSICVILVLLFSTLVNSWPPYWERLPGGYQAGGVERSVSPEGVDAAMWTLTALGPGNRFAADVGNGPLLGSYGNQSIVLGVSFLYDSADVTSSDEALVQALSIEYVLVDLRLSRQLPVSGAYFPVDINGAQHYAHPLPIAYLEKFNAIPGISRIYDSGNIIIYSLKGSEYYGS